MSRSRSDRLYPPRPMGRRELEAAALVRESPGMTLAELADALGVSLTRVDQIVNRLEYGGRVQRLSRRVPPPRFES